MGQVLAEHSGLKLQSFNGFTTHKPRCHLLPEMLWHTKLIKEGCECRSCSLFFLWEPVSLLYLVSGFRSSQWQDRTGQAGRDPGRTGERRKGDVWIFSDKIFPEKKKKKKLSWMWRVPSQHTWLAASLTNSVTDQIQLFHLPGCQLVANAASPSFDSFVEKWLAMWKGTVIEISLVRDFHNKILALQN